MGRGVLPIYMMEVAHEKKTDFDAPGWSGRISFAKRQRDMVCRCLVE